MKELSEHEQCLLVWLLELLLKELLAPLLASLVSVDKFQEAL
jgi:hypothetical protein